MFGDRKNKRLGILDNIFIWIDNKKELSMTEDMLITPSYNVDIANRIIDILVEKKPYGIYHINNSDVTNYYEFTKRIMDAVNSDVKLSAIKANQFLKENRPYKLYMESNKLTPLRSWKDALDEYIRKRYDK